MKKLILAAVLAMSLSGCFYQNVSHGDIQWLRNFVAITVELTTSRLISLVLKASLARMKHILDCTFDECG